MITEGLGEQALGFGQRERERDSLLLDAADPRPGGVGERLVQSPLVVRQVRYRTSRARLELVQRIRSRVAARER